MHECSNFYVGGFLKDFSQNSIFSPVEIELFILDLCNSYSTFFIPSPLAHPPPSLLFVLGVGGLDLLDLSNSYSTFFIPCPLAHPPPSWIENVNKLSVADTGSGINIRIIG